MMPYPEWLHVFAWAYLAVSFACALLIAADEIRRPQKMIVMDFVWPITALYFGPAALWGYFRSGPKLTKRHHDRLQQEVQAEPRSERTSRDRSLPAPTAPRQGLTREQVAVAATHCGAGCTLGDIVGEWWIFGAGLMIAGGGLGSRLLLDFLLAWVFGVAFQYFTIAPMRNLSMGRGLLQAIRADTLSIVAFQVGMSAWSALTYFVLFPSPHLKPNQAVFWFMMQVGMILGFFTSYPVNILLIGKRWKEKMPQDEPQMKNKLREEQRQQQEAA